MTNVSQLKKRQGSKTLSKRCVFAAQLQMPMFKFREAPHVSALTMHWDDGTVILIFHYHNLPDVESSDHTFASADILYAGLMAKGSDEAAKLRRLLVDLQQPMFADLQADVPLDEGMAGLNPEQQKAVSR